MVEHAWIDLNNGRVYDPVRDEYVVAKDYAAFMGGAVADHRYTRRQAMAASETPETMDHGNKQPASAGLFPRDVAR
jgi:hypothetical protein